MWANSKWACENVWEFLINKERLLGIIQYVKTFVDKCSFSMFIKCRYSKKNVNLYSLIYPMTTITIVTNRNH